MLDNHYIDNVTVCIAPRERKWGREPVSFPRTPFWTLFFRVPVSAKFPNEKLHQAYTSISAVSFDSSGRYTFTCLTRRCCLGLKNIGLVIVFCYSVLGTKESDIPLSLWIFGEPGISSSLQFKTHTLLGLLHFTDQDALIHAILLP